MEEQSQGIVLARALDRLKACADGSQTRVCLTSRESEKICAYIWWLTDQFAKAKEVQNEEVLRDA